MANSLSTFAPEFWSKTAQVLWKPQAIYRQVANFRGEADMKFGDVFHRILPNTTAVQNYSRYSDIDAQDISGTDETLTINLEKAFRFEVDDFDEIQSNLSLAGVFSKNGVADLANVVDSDLLYEAVNATSTLDDGTLSSGTASGTPLSVSGTNVFEAFAVADQLLAEQNVPLDQKFGAISPDVARVIMAQNGARETEMGDSVTRAGYMGNMIRYAGYDLYVTNNYTRRAVLSLATQPTNNDPLTITIGGQACTVTFVTSIGTTAGNVLIGANVDATRANLAGLINAPSTTSSTQVAYTGASLYAMQRCFAVNSNSADTLTLYCKGKSLSVAETLTDATDTWTSAQNSSVLMLGRKGAVDMVIQEAPKFKIKEEPRRFGSNLLGKSLYGVKTFTDGSKQLVNLFVSRANGK